MLTVLNILYPATQLWYISPVGSRCHISPCEGFYLSSTWCCSDWWFHEVTRHCALYCSSHCNKTFLIFLHASTFNSLKIQLTFKTEWDPGDFPTMHALCQTVTDSPQQMALLSPVCSTESVQLCVWDRFMQTVYRLVCSLQEPEFSVKPVLWLFGFVLNEFLRKPNVFVFY